jgi:hypothetical protein
MDRIQREIRQEQGSDTTVDQDFVTPALYHMPNEVVRVRVRTSARRESVFWSCVLDSTRQRCNRHSEAERHNERIRRRPEADQRAQWNYGRETEVSRTTDKISQSPSK